MCLCPQGLPSPIGTPGHTVFAYVIEGEGYFDKERNPFAHEVIGDNYFDFKRDCLCRPETLILYEREVKRLSSPQSTLRCASSSSRADHRRTGRMVRSIVMNTQEELKTAFEEFEKGIFIKHKGKRTVKDGKHYWLMNQNPRSSPLAT